MADARKEMEMAVTAKRMGEDRIITVPNIITLARLALIPVFFYLYVWSDYKGVAVSIFVVAACTDWIDGLVARRTNAVTNFGKTADPLADRILIVSGIVAVYLVDRVPLWLMLAIFLRDFVLLLLVAWLDRKHGEKLVVAYVGKVATCFVMGSFAFLLLGWPIVPGLGWIDLNWLPGFGAGEAFFGIFTLYIGVFLQWVTAAVYLYRGIRFGSTRKQR